MSQLARVENAYEYMMQNNAEKAEANKQLIIQIKQEQVENIEKCAQELDEEKANSAKLEVQIDRLQEKLHFSQSREVEHVKNIKSFQETIRNLESRVRVEDVQSKAEKISLLEMLRIKSEEFQRDISQIGISIHNMQA